MAIGLGETLERALGRRIAFNGLGREWQALLRLAVEGAVALTPHLTVARFGAGQFRPS